MEENNNQYQPQPGQVPPNPAPPYYQPPTQPYPAPTYANPITYENNEPLSVGNYIVMMIVSAIPLVGLIMNIVWAFSGNTNKNRQNYARAMLILTLIGIVLSIVLYGTIFASLISSGAFSSGSMY